MNAIESFANSALGRMPKQPMTSVPMMTVMAVTAVGALGFAAFMAGNAVTDFVGEEIAADTGADLSDLSTDDLMGLRSMATAA